MTKGFGAILPRWEVPRVSHADLSLTSQAGLATKAACQPTNTRKLNVIWLWTIAEGAQALDGGLHRACCVDCKALIDKPMDLQP